MEVQQLRYICAIAELGSFSRAAEQCHVAQPSLSQQVQKLEEELGTRLFDRLGRSVRMTDAGRAFLPHARSVLHQLEAARTSVVNQSASLGGSITVGAIPTVAPYLLPHATAAFRTQHPEARLRIVEETTPLLLEELRNLSIDFALLALPLRHKELAVTRLLVEPLYAVLPKHHSATKLKSLTLHQLEGEDFVMLRDGHCFRDLSLAACSRARVRPHVSFESDQFRSLLGMVAAGVGVSLVPEMAIDRSLDCAYVRLSDPQARRTVVVAQLRGRSLNRAQQAFLAGLRR